MISYNFFNNNDIHLTISSVDETAVIVEELGDLLQLSPSNGPAAIQVVLFSLENPPDWVGGRLQSGSETTRWRSHDIQSRFLVHESPDRNTFLCGVRLFPWWYPTRETRFHLVSMLVSAVLGLLSDRLLLIHAALITDGERGFVLTGPSGVGKSTAAARVPQPWRAPADDLIAAVPSKEGYVLYPLPTWSQLESGPTAFRPGDLNASSPLDGVMFLEQSESDAFEGITRGEAIVRLLVNSYEVYRSTLDCLADQDRLRCKREMLMHVTRILDGAQCGILKVSRNGRFWEILPER